MERPHRISLARLTDPAAVRAAIEEYDRVGRDAFLRKYGFGDAKDYFLEHGGRHYDSKAIVGAAYGYQHGLPLTPHQFSGGEATVLRLLRALGFTVIKVGDIGGKNWTDQELEAAAEAELGAGKQPEEHRDLVRQV